jgi:hypothetical protein
MFGFGRFIKKKSSQIFEKCAQHLARHLTRELATSGFGSHGIFLEKSLQEMRELSGQLKTIEDQMTEYHRAAFLNQITLANKKNNDDSVILYIPWSHNQRSTFFLERSALGELTFRPAVKSNRKPVFVVTLPKSGTHLVAQILSILEYQYSGVIFDSHIIHDNRRLGTIKKLDAAEGVAYTKANRDTDFRYPLMVNLSQNGYYYQSHVADAEALRLAHKDGKILLSVRDIRYLMISCFRWAIRSNQMSFENVVGRARLASNEIQSVHLLKFFNAGMAQFLLATAKTAVEVINEPFVRLVRFEEMVSHDLDVMRKSAESIADVTEMPVENIFQAMEQANGQQTSTYSGKLSELGDFWTQEVEDKFIELGGDVLNEQLGYSRHYTPGSGQYSVMGKEREGKSNR